MNSAINPRSGLVEECTRTEPPFFVNDPVRIEFLTSTYFIDTVDVDGDDSRCRVRADGLSTTAIVAVEHLRRKSSQQVA